MRLLVFLLVILAGCVDSSVPPPRLSGDLIPDFTLHEFTADGESSRTHTLSDYQGQIIVLYFWATWCIPCIEEFPAVTQLVEEYEGRNVKFFGIVFEDSKSNAQRYLSDHGSPAVVQLWDTGVAGKAFGVPGLPAAFVINQKGRLSLAFIGAAPELQMYLRTEVDSLLAL
jgi:cytochrome c biogenesis protein CcmG, thiol:disulfide interchange protein DsbE